MECVESLIDHSHEVDCRDELGWPPLLYAHFQDHQECVLALMKAKPQQVVRSLVLTDSTTSQADSTGFQALKCSV